MKTQASGYPSNVTRMNKKINILDNKKNTKEYVWIQIR